VGLEELAEEVVEEASAVVVEAASAEGAAAVSVWAPEAWRHCE